MDVGAAVSLRRPTADAIADPDQLLAILSGFYDEFASRARDVAAAFKAIVYASVRGRLLMTLAYFTEANSFGLAGWLPTSSQAITTSAAEYGPGVIAERATMTIKVLSNTLTAGSVTVILGSSTMGTTVLSQTFIPGPPAGVTVVSGLTGSINPNDTYGVSVGELTAAGVSPFAFSVVVEFFAA